MKVEGKTTEKHPVVYKLAHIRTLLDKLRPIDSKMEKAIVMILMQENDESEGASENEEIDS